VDVPVDISRLADLLPDWTLLLDAVMPGNALIDSSSELRLEGATTVDAGHVRDAAALVPPPADRSSLAVVEDLARGLLAVRYGGAVVDWLVPWRGALEGPASTLPAIQNPRLVGKVRYTVTIGPSSQAKVGGEQGATATEEATAKGAGSVAVIVDRPVEGDDLASLERAAGEG
jgi:hypothetical protein